MTPLPCHGLDLNRADLCEGYHDGRTRHERLSHHTSEDAARRLIGGNLRGELPGSSDAMAAYWVGALHSILLGRGAGRENAHPEETP